MNNNKKKKIRIRKIDKDELKRTLSGCSDKSTVYFGSDSKMFYEDDKSFILFSFVVVVHMESSNGARLFIEQKIEELPSKASENMKKRPYKRLLSEVEYLTKQFKRIIEYCEDEILDKHIEIHLDLSDDSRNFSSLVVQSAIGYVLGTCHITPKVKPESFVATCVADRFTRRL